MGHRTILALAIVVLAVGSASRTTGQEPDRLERADRLVADYDRLIADIEEKSMDPYREARARIVYPDMFSASFRRLHGKQLQKNVWDDEDAWGRGRGDGLLAEDAGYPAGVALSLELNALKARILYEYPDWKRTYVVARRGRELKKALEAREEAYEKQRDKIRDDLRADGVATIRRTVPLSALPAMPETITPAEYFRRLKEGYEEDCEKLRRENNARGREARRKMRRLEEEFEVAKKREARCRELEKEYLVQLKRRCAAEIQSEVAKLHAVDGVDALRAYKRARDLARRHAGTARLLEEGGHTEKAAEMREKADTYRAEMQGIPEDFLELLQGKLEGEWPIEAVRCEDEEATEVGGQEKATPQGQPESERGGMDKGTANGPETTGKRHRRRPEPKRSGER